MRRLKTTLTILTVALLTHAQSWTAVSPHLYNDETIVYATISNDLDDSIDEWMLAAFIDGECRAEAHEPSVGVDGSLFFILRVYGDRDADKGKPVTFKVCHKTTRQEYECQSSTSVIFDGMSYGMPSEPILLTFTTIEIPLQHFLVSLDSLVAGQTGQLCLTPVPANATIHIDDLPLTFVGEGDLGTWNTISCELVSLEPIILYSIKSTIPRQYQFSIGDIPLYQPDGETPFTGFEVAAPLTLYEGWQWRTNCYGDVSTADFERVYGANALTEIRTEDNLLYNDPSYGYYGTLMEAGLPQNMPYKVLMANELTGELKHGHYAPGYRVTINDGWTWIPSPYYTDHLLSTIFNTSELPEGLVIISKDRGSAEWDGTEWIGDLQILPAYESFLCYAGIEESFALNFLPEADLLSGNDEAPTETPAEARNIPDAPWHYNAARFRDNLTLVMQLPQLDNPADFSIGAFVGNECRGEGHFVTGHQQAAGYFFITVHCYQGERVNFRLCHLPSGQQFAIDQTVNSTGLHIGSLRQPLTCTSEEQATAISETNADRMPHVIQTYDLTGRKVQSPRHGLLIQQLSDGTVRRIIR